MIRKLSLNGQWMLARASAPEKLIPAHVPGCVHLDLMAAGELEDPYYRDNERQQFWVGETDWIYQRTFTVTPDLLTHDTIRLRCHGLDTLAQISINGNVIGRADNMFRTWEFDVEPYLRAGENAIRIRFEAPMPFVRRMDEERGPMPGWVEPMRVNSGGWIRKEPCNFGWDWGPMLITSGIWRDIEILAWDSARLGDVLVEQDHSQPGSVTLLISGTVDTGKIFGQKVDVSVLYEGAEIGAARDLPVQDRKFRTAIRIDDPKLWWIRGLGDQPLYTVSVTLCEGGQRRDAWERRIGLRTLRLERRADKWGEQFAFSINNVPFFAKGANWIPADPFVARVRREDYARLIGAAADAHMNMLRVWGGGIYEDDAFYDLCDEYGIAVWQDFIFACGVYPAFDEDFMENVAAEARDNVIRLRHHACLALWCGNNEIEQGMADSGWKETVSWQDHALLFDGLLPRIVRQYDPQRSYWPGSPHSPHGDREDHMNPKWGDTHLWAVWHGKQPFEWYHTRLDRFVSEFGFQSFPEPHTVAGFTAPEDRNLTSYVMEHHQRSAIGNSTIIHYMLDWFRQPTSFDNTVWLSQILQGMAMKYAVEGWRRNMPRTMGCLYWQLNDCWPAPTWSSLDHHGRWKALHYMARRFYAPVLVSLVEDKPAQAVAIHLTSDALEPIRGTLTWRVTDAEGAPIASESREVEALPQQNRLVMTLNCASYLARAGLRNLCVWAEFAVDGVVVSENFVTFVRPKHLALKKPRIRLASETQPDGTLRVTLKTNLAALFVWVQHPAGPVQASDNFFHLLPDTPKTITVRLPERADAAGLRAYSLVDTHL